MDLQAMRREQIGRPDFAASSLERPGHAVYFLPTECSAWTLSAERVPLQEE